MLRSIVVRPSASGRIRRWRRRLKAIVSLSGLCVLAIGLQLSGPVVGVSQATQASSTDEAGSIVVESATVFPDKEIDVPAPMSGRISKLYVDENLMVVEGGLIAQIDDRRAQSLRRLAEAKLAAAELEATDNSAILEAEATYALAKVEHQRNVDLLKTNAISPAEVDRTELASKQAELRLQNRLKQFELAQKGLEIARLELADAEQEVEMHKLTAPGPGNIYTLFHEEGEWVTEGEPLVKIVRMEWLRVEGTIDNSRFNREDAHGRRVTIRFERARGEVIEFEGQITWTGLREVTGRNIQVRAMVRNRIVADHWVLHPGAHVRMTIHEEQAEVAELPEDVRR